jgi:hypothetical protein
MVGRSENTAGGVGLLCHNIERLVEKTGAAVVYAHHFTKGNAAKKKAIDRMSGSGVFARDADTIITLTEHEREGCYAVEMTLRNLPPQPAFVVEWDFPVMVERPDLNASDLRRDNELGDDDLEPLVELLDEAPLTTRCWQTAAEGVGYSRATFFRMKQKIETAKRVQYDAKSKTWARSNDDISQSQVSSAETGETAETAPEGDPGISTTREASNSTAPSGPNAPGAMRPPGPSR